MTETTKTDATGQVKVITEEPKGLVKKVTESYTDRTTNEVVVKVSEQNAQSGITQKTETYQSTEGVKRQVKETVVEEKTATGEIKQTSTKTEQKMAESGKYVTDKVITTTAVRDVKSGEVEKKIVEADATGKLTKEVIEKTSASGEIAKETKIVKEGGKIETVKEVTDKLTGKV